VANPPFCFPGGLSQAALSRTVVITLRENSASVPGSRDALASSNPFSTEGPCITVRMDRLRLMVQRNPLRTGFLLGHVLAHEIGHVLQQIDHHSEAGVMKSGWSDGEIASMTKHRLGFTALDRKLILEGLAGRGPRSR
jgi:hypothetical protein